MQNYIPSILISILLILTIQSQAQFDSLSLPDELTYQIESYIENLEAEVDFDYNTLYEALNTYLQKPLNINKASTYQLESLGLLNDFQVNSLINYRERNGALIAIYELQAVPHFDLPTIYRILPFITINKSLDDLNESFAAILAKSKKNLFLRWSRNIEVPKGFNSMEDGTPPAYLGDVNKYYVRFAQAYENRISFGMTLEKDPGEAFFKGNNKEGFDFMSGHFLYKKVNKTIERIVIGDFRARFGQGLILNTSYAPGKSAFVTSIRRSGPILNRFTSVNEQNFLRGIGTTLKLAKNLSWSSFVSNRKRDGNIILVDTTDTDLNIQNFTSLQFSGLHRTQKEISNKNTLQQFNFGTSLSYKNSKTKLGVNILYSQFDRPLGNSNKPYNQFYFKGQRLLNASLDYTYFYQNFIFFGETAWSNNHQFATVNGIIATLSPKVSFSLQSRFLPKDFHSIFGQTFSETTGTNNENGLYLGLEIRPTNLWRFTAYVDSWQHPWLRFRTDAPSKGKEYFARITYYKRRDLEAYFQWKYESKQESYRFDYTKFDELLYKYKTNIRFHINKKITKRLELRSRLEWSIFDIEDSTNPKGLIWYDQKFQLQESARKTGFLVYQDLIFKPVNIPFAFTTRFAIFDIGSYDARIYAYENDVAYQFSVPAYYNKGTRFYAIFKYRAKRHLTLEARFAQTFWANQTSFSSGNNQIEGQTKSEMKVQVRWRF